jgi:hypothetical protein
MGFWLHQGGSAKWVGGSPNEAQHVKTNKLKWWSSWLPSMWGTVNSEQPIYKPAQMYVDRDIKRLRALGEEALGEWTFLKGMINNALEHVDNGLVQISHKESRDEAFLELVKDDPRCLYKIRYKANDADDAWRLSYLLHELVHLDADQRYRYHSDSAKEVICINANGDPADATKDSALIGAHLEKLDSNNGALYDAVQKMDAGALKDHLVRREQRSRVLINEWDSVLTELSLFLYMSRTRISVGDPVVKLVKKFATEAFDLRNQNPARGRTKRPGGVN